MCIPILQVVSDQSNWKVYIITQQPQILADSLHNSGNLYWIQINLFIKMKDSNASWKVTREISETSDAIIGIYIHSDGC